MSQNGTGSEPRTVEDSTDDSTNDLHGERHTRCELDVLTKFQVRQHQDTLALGVLAVQRAVHVRDRLARDHVRSDHLVEAVGRRAELLETDRRRERREEQGQRKRDEKDHGQRPPRQAGMAAIVRRLRDSIRSGEEDEIPPARDLLVDLHLLVVRVVYGEGGLVPGVERLEEGFDVLPVPEEDVGERSAKGKVRGDEVERVRSREERRL